MYKIYLKRWKMCVCVYIYIYIYISIFSLLSSYQLGFYLWKVISPKVDASIKSEGALPRGNISLIFCDMILTSSRGWVNTRRDLNLLNWVLMTVRNLTLRVNEATVCVNAEMNSYASRTFFHTDWTIVAPLFYSLRFSVCLPAYICKGVAEKPHVHRAVSHQCFLKLLWIWKNNTVCFPAVTVLHIKLIGNVRVSREDMTLLPRPM